MIEYYIVNFMQTKAGKQNKAISAIILNKYTDSTKLTLFKIGTKN